MRATIPWRAAAVVAAAGAAIVGPTTTTPGASAVAATAPVPVERAEYQVKLGILSVGSGEMEAFAHDTVDGRETYHAVLRISGGTPLARVDDVFESWIDAKSWADKRNVFSRRFRQQTREVRYKRDRTYDFFPERRQYRREDNGETGALPTDQPLDDVSMVYFARSLPLKVGETYTIPRYFKADANPVVLKVVRREQVTVPAGTFQTVVVQPRIKTSGLFGEGGQAELFFSDDALHTLVQMRSKVKVVGSLSLYLRSYTPPAAQVGGGR